MTFDTLSYARRLRQAGVPEQQAEAIADATRELVAQDVASKSDITAVRSEITAVRSELAAVEQRLKLQIETLDQRLTAAIDTQSLGLTVRLGLMMAAGFSLMTALLSFLARLH
jgi:hypothetical protein